MQLPPPPPPSSKENAAPAGPPMPGAGYGYDAGVYAQMYNMQYYQAIAAAAANGGSQWTAPPAPGYPSIPAVKAP